MKPVINLVFFLLLVGTSIGHASLSSLPPQEMLENAKFILVGMVDEVYSDGQDSRVVVKPELFYKGKIEKFSLSIPLPAPDDSNSIRLPVKGSRMLLLLSVSDTGRLIPVADLNWSALLEDGKVRDLFFGAAVLQWEEQEYIDAYNEFLLSVDGLRIEEPLEKDDNKALVTKGMVNPSIFFILAGLTLLLLLLSAFIKNTNYKKM